MMKQASGSGLARKAKNPKEALKYYKMADEYPENMSIAPREPDLRGFIYYPMAGLHQELGNKEEADRLLKITARESTSRPTLVTYYQALALKYLGSGEKADKLIAEFEAEAKRLIQINEGGNGNRSSEFNTALGHYYLAKFYEATNEKGKAGEYMENAKSLMPFIEREAIIIAQMAYSRASQ